jgi:hypothetical protein
VRQDEHREIAAAAALAARRRDHGPHADIAPREVIAAELDAYVRGRERLRRELPLRVQRDDAVMGGEHEIFVDERAGAGRRRTDDAHDRILGDGERDGRRKEPRIERRLFIELRRGP